MAIKGLIGAVYEIEAAPVSENIALLFDWTLEVQHRKEFTYGPQMHMITEGWYVKAKAYWAQNNVQQRQAFLRLFIGKDENKRCFAGQVNLPELKQTDGINESEIRLEGVGLIEQEDEYGKK